MGEFCGRGDDLYSGLKLSNFTIPKVNLSIILYYFTTHLTSQTFFVPFYLFIYFTISLSLSSSFSLFLKLTNNHNNATTMPIPCQNHATVQQHKNPLKKPPNKHNTTLPPTRQNHATAIVATMTP